MRWQVCPERQAFLEGLEKQALLDHLDTRGGWEMRVQLEKILTVHTADVDHRGLVRRGEAILSSGAV